MIINAWDSSFTSKYGHQFPTSYLCFDTEFTGRSERDDLIVEIGHVLVEDGKVVDKLNLVLNWYELDVVPSAWLDYKLNQMRYIVGPGWRLLPEVVKAEGINPLQALRFYYKLFQTWAQRNMPFVAQNGINADEPMLRGNLNRFLNRPFEIPANSYFDTGAIFKANQVWQSHDNELANYRSVMLPSRTDTLKSYFQRICGVRIRGLQWSLKLILEHYDLIQKHKLDATKLHNAGFDAMCLHLIMEEYRSHVHSIKSSTAKPVESLDRKFAECWQETIHPQNGSVSLNSTKVTPQRTPGPVRKQRPI